MPTIWHFAMWFAITVVIVIAMPALIQLMGRLAVWLHGDRVRPKALSSRMWRTGPLWRRYLTLFALMLLVVGSAVSVRLTFEWSLGRPGGWPAAPIAIAVTAVIAWPLLWIATWPYTLAMTSPDA